MKCVLIALLTLLAAAAHSQQCDLSLRGHVEDIDSKEKLQAATVQIVELDLQMVTNANGDFEFSSLCPGVYTVVVSHVSCETISRTINLNRTRHFDFLLPHEKNALEVVTVAGQRGIQNTGFKQELSGRQLDESRGLSIAEALSKLNGVTLLQTGATVSKPVVHGLHSNRILTINNGVRQEGQQWGNEHAPEIDPFLSDRLVVVKGVDELRYGSDAIGGVIIVDPKPLSGTPGLSGEFNAGYFTNNRLYYGSAIIEHQLKKAPSFSYRVQGTFKKAANVKTPGYFLNNTGMQEENFSFTAAYKKEKYSFEAFYSQFHTKIGIFTGAHIGNLTDLQAAILRQEPDPIYTGQRTYRIARPNQDVTHRLAKLKSTVSIGKSRFHAMVAAQLNDRKEFDVTRSSNTSGPQLDLSIVTITEDLSWDHPELKNVRGTVGLSFVQQENSYGGRYFIPNYTSATFGGYLIEKWSKKKWDLQAGLRYDNKSIDTRRMMYGGNEINHSFNFSTLASSVNLQHRFSPQLRANINVTLANRAPHVNELLSNGLHHGTATYEEGNISLSPEQSVNTALSFSYNNKTRTFNVDVNAYNNNISNFIYQQPKPDEPVLTIAGAFPKLKYEQVDAVLRGVDVTVSTVFDQKFNWISRASILRAKNRSIDDWMILMPSDRLSNEFIYQFHSHEKRTESYVSVEISNVFRQTRVPSDKNGKQDYKLPPAGYTMIRLNASTEVSLYRRTFRLSIGVSNLLNTAYREYLNSFRYFADEIGRNFQFRINVPFKH